MPITGKEKLVSRNAARPLSPHLTIWKWGPHMLVSILHRVTGCAMAIGGGVIFTWWLVAAASGAKTYAGFYAWVVEGQSAGQHLVNWLALLVGIGLTWAFFQHMASGIRHFVLDTGAGYELKVNRTGSIATMAFSVLATIAFWLLVGAKF